MQKDAAKDQKAIERLYALKLKGMRNWKKRLMIYRHSYWKLINNLLG